MTLDHPAGSLQGGKNPPRRWQASCSRRLERDVEELRGRFPLLETFGNNAERKSLDAGYGFITILPIAQHPGQSGNLGDPTTILFAFKLDREGHETNVPSPSVIHQLGV